VHPATPGQPGFPAVIALEFETKPNRAPGEGEAPPRPVCTGAPASDHPAMGRGRGGVGATHRSTPRKIFKTLRPKIRSCTATIVAG
jgi:hypothetical protein